MQEIHDLLVKKVKKAMGKNETPSVEIIDNQSVKTTQKVNPEVTILEKDKRPKASYYCRYARYDQYS